MALRLNYWPSNLNNYPFVTVAESDCAANASSMPPNATCTLDVTFSPMSGETPGKTFTDSTNEFVQWQYLACVTGACNDPMPGGHVYGPIPVTGTVAAPTGIAQASFSPANPDNVGSIAVGANQLVTVTLSNLGGDAMSNLGIYVGSNASGQISGTSGGTCGGSLAGGASCTTLLRINPASWVAAGSTQTGTLTVQWMDVPNGYSSGSANYVINFVRQ
ncbi:hypothetical protein F6X40_11405 [Paraburkholderia sp. UCT31]|uniref:hypothetical protein n=1 Tax=Paraburkholderia sp. UCT31 TaxID=2615209 RepID=UPI0016563FDD|nr:hypothetical protein [Paraburkholderia sp. UCT31]MBC8737411.1 hypothetical protein [Paraburkholderia sp. UCT31]